MKIRILINIVMVMIKFCQAQDFNVTLNSSILLNSNYSGISAIAKDLENNFLVSFLSGQARRYTSDLISYISFVVPQSVDKFDKRRFLLNSVFSNGSSFLFEGNTILIFSNNSYKLRDYDYNKLTQLQPTINVDQNIISQFGWPLNITNVTNSLHILICNKSIMTAYKGLVTKYDYHFIIGAHAICSAAVFYSNPYAPPYSTGQNMLSFKPIFFVSLNNIVYNITVSLTFTFNFTTNHYDLTSTSFIQSLIYVSPSGVTMLSISNGLLMMQSNSTGVTNIYNLYTLAMGVTSGIPLNQTFTFFYLNFAFYALQSRGFIKLSFNSSTNTLALNSSINTLPYNYYGLILGPTINPFYIPRQPYLYKGGACSGNKQPSGGYCVSYNCIDRHCQFCQFSAQLCNICNSRYIVNENYTCKFTTNNTANFNLNQIFNSSISDYFLNNLRANNQFLKIFSDIVNFFISVPGARRVISPIFYYFGIFDDIYFYQFHDRLYGDTMNGVFLSINDIESKKWSYINYQRLLQLFYIHKQTFQNITDYKKQYDKYLFKDQNHPDVGSEGVWANCQNFFIVALPLTIFVFLVGRIMFRKLFNYKISKLLRKFDFWPTLFLLIFDGNIQQFAFYQATEWKNTFYFDIFSKIVKFQIILFGFSIILVSAGLIFLSYGFYNKLNKNIMDNNQNIIFGHLCFMMQIGIKNCYLGVIHSFGRSLKYSHMLYILLGSQIFFNIFFFVSVSMKVYKYKTKIWIYILLNIYKITLIVTLFIDYQNINIPIIQKIHEFLILLELGTFFVGILLQTYLTLSQIISFIKAFLVCKARAKNKRKMKKKQQNILNMSVPFSPKHNTIKFYKHPLKKTNRQILKLKTHVLIKDNCQQFKMKKRSIKYHNKLTIKII